MVFPAISLFLCLGSCFSLIPPLLHRSNWKSNLFETKETVTENSKTLEKGSEFSKLDETDIVTAIRSQTFDPLDLKEERFRKFQFQKYNLPSLSDCNNYYSGKFGTSFWLQDADHVLIYLPIVDDSLESKDIKMKFEASKFIISLNPPHNVPVQHTVNLPEKVIPDGCFWTIEECNPKDDSMPMIPKRFIQLDLEKRLRMLNWKNLFKDAPVLSEEDAEFEDNRKNDLLEKLYSANKGMSKLAGVDEDDNLSFETLEEMKNNPDLMRSITSEVNIKPHIVGATDENGNEIIDYESDPDVQQLNERILDGSFQGVQNIPTKESIIDAEIVEK
jgi:hypothetical protein